MATAYHRLAREHPDHAWWKLPVAGLIGAAGYVAVVIAVVTAVMVVAAVSGPAPLADLEHWLDDTGSGLMTSPWSFAFMLGVVALMLPAVLLGVLATGPRPVGYLSSVQGRLRWSWLARCTAVAFALYGFTIGGSLALGWGGGDLVAPSLAHDAVLYFAIALLLTPVQATAEEYVFRGYLLQLVGSWTRWAFVPVLVSTPLFVAGHLYEFWGMVDVTVFALMAAYLVIRTGGLEAAIAAHVANNLVLFTIESFNGVAATGQDYRAVDVLPTVVTSVVFVVIVEKMARSSDLVRTRPPVPPRPVPVMWVPVGAYPYSYPPPQPYAWARPVAVHPPGAYPPPLYPPPPPPPPPHGDLR